MENLSAGITSIHDLVSSNQVREGPLMTSDFRVGRVIQNDPKIGRFRVEKGR